MSAWISVLNGGAVSLFGTVLAAAFCVVDQNRRNKMVFWGGTVLLLLGQALVYQLWDFGFLRGIYPLVVHVPLLVLLYFLTGKLLWPVISILTAYLCCQTRRWIALAVTALLSGGAMVQETVELLVTLPLLVLLVKCVAPAVRPLAAYPILQQLQFGVVPALYYGFDYLTRVYTQLLFSGTPVAVEFMPFVCCGAYLAFLLRHNFEQQNQERLRAQQRSLDGQLAQAVREIEVLRESQALASQYRHDLRHHLQYLSGCLENGQIDQAQAYIGGICRELESQAIHRYCENETVNLILSAFSGRAKKSGIALSVHSVLSPELPVSEQDLCVLLSNALENALHACQQLAAQGRNCTIDVQMFLRENRLFLQVSNPCGSDVRFRDGIPTASQPGHGIGVQSICTVAERHGGIWDFQVKDSTFILRVSL